MNLLLSIVLFLLTACPAVAREVQPTDVLGLQGLKYHLKKRLGNRLNRGSQRGLSPCNRQGQIGLSVNVNYM